MQVGLLGRAWELNHTLGGFDTMCVASAEASDVALVRGDQRLAQASGIRCRIETVD